MPGGAAMGVSDGIAQALLGYGLTIVIAFATAAMIWAVVTTLGTVGRRRARPEAPASAATATVVAPEDMMAQHVAAVAAAVHAVIGEATRIRIADTGLGVSWRTTGRTMVQTSHIPQRPSRR